MFSNSDTQRPAMRIVVTFLQFVSVLARCGACLLLVCGATLTAAEKPNIVILFIDDMGYGDLGAYGGTKNRTPRLDELAAGGMRFTSFYAQSVCGPSRHALLSGRYPMRNGEGWAMPGAEFTFAEVLRTAGYQTACIGKWDVSMRRPVIEQMPLAQGFDSFYGTLGGNDTSRIDLYEGNKVVEQTTDMASLSRRYTDRAVAFIEKRDPARPFVLYLAHTMMHMDIAVSPSFRGKSDNGLYGDTLAELDHECGRLLDRLASLGLRENTLVVLASDNGAWNQPAYVNHKMKALGDRRAMYENTAIAGSSGPLRNAKGSCYEGGYRAPCIVSWPGRVAAGQVSDAIFATLDFLPTFAALAGASLPTGVAMDGVNQRDLLFGTSAKGARDSFYYQANGIRVGNWKFLRAKHQVADYAVDKERQLVPELYNLDEDIGETRNLADAHPEILVDLRQRCDALEKQLGPTTPQVKPDTFSRKPKAQEPKR